MSGKVKKQLFVFPMLSSQTNFEAGFICRHQDGGEKNGLTARQAANQSAEGEFPAYSFVIWVVGLFLPFRRFQSHHDIHHRRKQQGKGTLNVSWRVNCTKSYSW